MLKWAVLWASITVSLLVVQALLKKNKELTLDGAGICTLLWLLTLFQWTKDSNSSN